jgi:hypothetical protein
LNQSDGEAEKFYRDLKRRGVSVRVGMEATGYSRWFERLLAELSIEVWIWCGSEKGLCRLAEAAGLDTEVLHRLVVPDPSIAGRVLQSDRNEELE